MAKVIISPLVVGSLTGDFRETIDVSNWRHKISATIGFDTASFIYQAEKSELEEFFFYGCGRRVTRYSPDGNFVIWDGQIMEMTLNQPGGRETISLREMANGVIIRYNGLDTSTNPPTNLGSVTTTPIDDVASQAKYGVKQYFFRPPQQNTTSVEANQYANTILRHYRMPIRSSLSLGNQNEIGLLVTCEGFMRALNWHTYIQIVSSGTDNASTIISAIATATSQGFIDGTDIDTNTTQVRKYYNDYDSGFALIQKIASFGDASYNRWLAFVLEDRILKYKRASTTVQYWTRLSDKRREYYDAFSGRVVPYYELRPNNWLRIVDILPHHVAGSDLKDDFQTMFIESVEWSEPDSLNISGSVGDEIQVMTARMANQGDRLV